MPDIAGSINLEVRFPLAEGPRFISHVFIEYEDEGTIAIGVAKENGVYAYARITQEQWQAINTILDPQGEFRNANAQIRRSCD